MSRYKVAGVLAALITLSIAKPLFAQQNTPAAAADTTTKLRRAQIKGVVLDSLNGRYLSGADVIVEGAKATLITDSVGRFHIDSLAPGTYQVGVFHPLLDTLGLSLATKPFHLGADSTSVIVLSVPSASTIIHGTCPVRPRPQGTSAVIGHVTDPETMQPVAGAEVSIAWIQIEVGKEFGVRQTPRLIRDSTGVSGAYRLCGLPNSMKATLQAKRGSSVTAEIPITLGDQDTELFARTLLLSHVDSMTKEGNASVSGRVLLEGSPVRAGTRVELVGTEKIALTNEQGDFTLSKLPAGSHVLLARHLGFGAQTVAVDLTPHEPQRVSVKLPKFVAIIDPVVVNAKRTASLDRVGFSQRQKNGMGYYLGPEQIAMMHPQYLTDVLRRVPSLRVSSSGQGGDVVSSSRGTSSLTGGDCVQYYLDDMPWQSAEPGDINNFVNGNEIAAVEVYQGSTTPGQYMRAGGGCTTIVLWTHFKIRDR
jgi:hypothetical protein